MILDHIHGIDGIKPAVRAVPHKIIGIYIVCVGTEGALAELKHYLVFLAVKGVICANSHLITGNVIPIFRTEIEIYRSTVIFVAPDAYNLFTDR